MQEGQVARVTVTLSAPSAVPVSVAFATSDGTATVTGADYNAETGMITFTPGVTSIDIEVQTNSDNLDELDETFTVNLSSPLNATIADGSGLVTIEDVFVEPPTVSIEGVGNDGTTVEEGALAKFTVSLSSASAEAQTVTLGLTDGTADSSDYNNLQFFDVNGELIGDTLVFAPGETTQDVYVQTIDNDPPLNEPLENYTVSASLTGGNTDTASGGITDSDLPVVSIDSVQTEEGQPLSFTVTLSAASAGAVSVNWATALDVAGANPASAADFTGASGSVEFAPGETSKTVVIETLEDSINEPDETMLVQLSTPVGAVIGTGTGTGTILDDDGPTAGTTTATVDEDGLPAGLGDSADGDWVDTNADGDADESTFGGILPGSVGENGPASFDFASMHGQVAGIGGEQVSYAWDAGSNTLTATTIDGDRVGTDLFEVSVNPASGAYNVTLLSNALHGESGTEDDLTAALTYTVSDAVGDSVNGTLNIVIDDDLPVVTGGEQAVEPLNYNLTIMLDISGSMITATNISDGQGGTLTRFEAAVESINRLFDAYDSLGDVRVRLVTFSSSAVALGDSWTTTADARGLLEGLTLNGLTNYRAPLEVVSGIEGMSSGNFGSGAWYDSGKLADGVNIAYFASDGNPNVEGPINGARETAWEAFLEENEILSYALGMGSGVNALQLNPIAYDGRGGVDIDTLSVTDFAQLGDTIVATVPPIMGTLFTGLAGGADGMASLLVTIDGTTFTYNFGDDTLQVDGSLDYSFDESGNLLTVTSAKNGVWMIDLDAGSFTYQADATESGLDSLDFTLTDGDGDGVTSSVDIDLDASASDATVQPFIQVDEPAPLQTGFGVEVGAPLIGTADDDVFVWELADIGSPGNPDMDSVLQFGSEGNDVLDLSDLLVDAHPGEGGDIGDLEQFLSISSDGTDSVVRISSSGGFAGGTFDPSAVDQTITLMGVDLGDDSAQAIRDLLSSGQLLAD